jgi:hypothetical protein
MKKMSEKEPVEASENNKKWYTRAWLAIGALFLIVEGLALKRGKKGLTLSAHVWEWFKVHDKFGWQRAMLAVFMFWLSGHFIFGWWSL